MGSEAWWEGGVFPERSAQGEVRPRRGWAARAPAGASEARGSPSSSCREPRAVPPWREERTWERKSACRGQALGRVRKPETVAAYW